MSTNYVHTGISWFTDLDQIKRSAEALLWRFKKSYYYEGNTSDDPSIFLTTSLKTDMENFISSIEQTKEQGYVMNQTVSPFYLHLNRLGWHDEGRTGVEQTHHDFTYNNKRNKYLLRVDLQVMGIGTAVSIYVQYPKWKESGWEDQKLIFEGDIHENTDVDFLMKALQITL